MTKQRASTAGKIGAVAIIISFFAIGGLIGFIFYQCLQIFGRVNDTTVQIASIVLGAFIVGALGIWGLRKSVKTERQRLSSGGSSSSANSDMSFLSIISLGMMSDSGSSHHAGVSDWSGGGSDFSGHSGYSGDSGGFSGGDSGSF